jgi:5-methylcytosine-specific restriction enzyme A
MTKPVQREEKRQRGRKWLVRRARQLRLQPLCRHCLVLGVVKAAQEVDHVVALVNGGKDADDNLQSLCVECHKLKTAEDIGYTPRTEIGYDGWPVEGEGGRRGVRRF